MILGETIAAFDASSLLLDHSETSTLRLSYVPGIDAALTIQHEWQYSKFHWPAVVNRHPSATTLALHNGDDARSVQAMVQALPPALVLCDRVQRGPYNYVSFLEVAPWNLPGSTRKFVKLGSLLLAAISAWSRSMFNNGALALHSLDDAANFYRKTGLVEFNCANEYKELYFELGEEAAVALRSRHGATS